MNPNTDGGSWTVFLRGGAAGSGSPRSSGPVAVPEISQAATERPVPPLLSALQGAWKWIQRHGGATILTPRNRRLRVSETISLGDKRFVSIVEVDGTSFLIGGGTGSVVLLTPLTPRPESQSFPGALRVAWGEKEIA